jgi:hypothetical protein
VLLDPTRDDGILARNDDDLVDALFGQAVR